MGEMIYGLDPGTTQSALVGIRELDVEYKAILPNEELLPVLREAAATAPTGTVLACEMVQSFGMPVGRSVFETVVWLGRFVEAWGLEHEMIYRTTVKGHLCKSARAKDANVAQAVRNRFERSGGGATPEVGTKKQPGPLYGIKSHLWSALAVAITYAETR